MQSFLSLKVQIAYVFLTGAALAIMPNTILSIFDLQPTDEVYSRILGVIIFTLGILYLGIIKSGNREVIKTTVFGRLFAASGIIILALLGFSKLTLILFAGVDIVTASWTWWELKK
jgi:hypothetical protein